MADETQPPEESSEELVRLGDLGNRHPRDIAEEMRKNPQMARPLDPNSMRNLRSQDLRSMIDRM